MQWIDNDWFFLKTIFNQYDEKKNGYIPCSRLKSVLNDVGYKLPYNIAETLVGVYRDESHIYYDKFIQCAVQTAIIFGKITV